MINCAVVGTGYLGRFHAQKYAALEGARLCCVVDRDQERARKVAAEVGCEVAESYRDLPALGVQCASIASDTSTHFEIADWLLRNGVDVLVEKPMTTTSQESVSLVNSAKEFSRILQVGHLERFNPAFVAASEVVRAPRFFEARRIAPFSGRAFDVDVVRDLMIHDIDIVAHLAGSKIERIDAVGTPIITGSVDIANARLTFANGAIANVTASRAAFASERTIRMFGPSLYASIDLGNKKVKVCRISEERDVRGFPQLDLRELEVAPRDALLAEIEAFVSAVRERSEPLVPGEDGLRAVEIAERIEVVIAEQLSFTGEGNPMFQPEAALINGGR